MVIMIDVKVEVVGVVVIGMIVAVGRGGDCDGDGLC